MLATGCATIPSMLRTGYIISMLPNGIILTSLEKTAKLDVCMFKNGFAIIPVCLQKVMASFYYAYKQLYHHLTMLVQSLYHRISMHANACIILSTPGNIWTYQWGQCIRLLYMYILLCSCIMNYVYCVIWQWIQTNQLLLLFLRRMLQLQMDLWQASGRMFIRQPPFLSGLHISLLLVARLSVLSSARYSTVSKYH